MKNHRENGIARNAAEDRLFNFRPAFFAAISLCLGIVFFFSVKYYGVSAWWALSLLPVTVAPFLFCRSLFRVKRTLLAVAILWLFFGIGFASFFVQCDRFEENATYNGRFTVGGRVVERTEYEYSFGVVLEDVTIDGEVEEGTLVAYLPLSFSDKVSLFDTVRMVGEVESSGGKEMNFYRIDDDIRFSMQTDSCEVTGHPFELFSQIRERLRSVVNAGMDEASAELTLGILTGDTSGIGEGLLENVRRGGIAHVFAVSGLHIGSLFTFCILLFAKTRLRRLPKLVRFFLCAALLLFYGGICGFSASVIRATVVCLLFYASELIGIRTDSTENLSLAAILVLLLSPASLFTVGFQLSFAACLGIVWLARPIREGLSFVFERLGSFLFNRSREEIVKKKRERLFHPPTVWQRIVRGIASFFSVSMGAQLATAPILLISFGYLSVWSLFLNFLFVPLISGVFSVLLSTVAVACFLPIGASRILLYGSSVVWSAATLLFHAVDLSKTCIENVALSAYAVIPYYGGLIFLTDKWNVNKISRILLSILCFSVFGIAVYALNG